MESKILVTLAAAHLQNITKAVEVGLSLMDLRKLGRGAKESLRDESLANPLFMRRSYRVRLTPTDSEKCIG